MKKLFLLSLLSIIVVCIFTAFSYGQQDSQYLSFKDGYQLQDNENTLPNRETLNGGEAYYQIGFSFPGTLISTINVENADYQILHIEGFSKMGTIGAPALPAHNEVIAMPRGSTPEVVLINTEYYEYEGFMIHPVLEPARDTYGAPEPEFWVDETVYGRDEYYPKNVVDITDVWLSRGTPLAVARICPVQFNPVTGKIRVYTKILYRVEFKGGSASFSDISFDNSLHYTNLLKRNVINSVSIPDGIAGSENKAGEKNYIIITHDEFLSAANDLANWKRQMGYSVEVVSQSSWTAAQVKTAISNLYNSWTPKPDYFLIIGDHTGSYAVPGDVIYTPYAPPEEGPFATDLYFACMDGGSDYHPDMAHGRISPSTLAEAQIIVNKIINYEKNPVTNADYYTHGLNCAQFQDDDDNTYADRRFCHTSENIRDYLQGQQGYTVQRIYFTDSPDPTYYNNGYYSPSNMQIPAEMQLPSFNWNGGATDITSAINAGQFYVFHRDHGYVGGSGWHRPYYTTTSMNSLSNGDLLPVVFSINCHTGEYQLSNCFAEKLLRMENKGAVGVFGAAYFSLSGWNDAFSLGVIDAIWANPGVYPIFGSAGTGLNYTIGAGNEIYTMGDVMNQGLYAMEQNFNGSSTYDKYTYELFHYFGDPAMKMWTENPNNNVITATHNADIDCSVSSFSISNSTAGATATLVFDNELIGETVLDGSGNGTINYSITGSGTTVILTISKTNHKPYEANLNLIGTCNPPAVGTDTATALTQTSAIIHGEILNNFGNTITESGFVYSTSPNPMIGGAGVIKIETSPTVVTGTFNLPLAGLTPATTFYFKAYAISAGGTGYGPSEIFSTLCGIISSLPFTQDFSAVGLPDCWANIDNDGGGQIWEFTSARTFNSTTNANGFAILDSDAYGSGNSQDADLVTPEFDFSGYVSVNLHFEYYYRHYQAELASVEYSIDGGNNWTVLQSWSATTANALTYNEDISTQVAGESSVKFKWNYTGTWGYYFMIDDISITGVEGSPTQNQVTNLAGGWNITSFCVTPSSCNMISLFQPLIDNSTLVKITDEAGGIVQYIPGPGWLNTIGDMSNTEGYYVNLTTAGNITTNGSPVTYPYDIPLYTGWNIMGYPCEVSQNAITVIQPLIDAGYLVKVLSESGGIIQNIPGVGWLNTIVNFYPGDGYYINVNTNCTLTLTDPGKDTEPLSKPELPMATEYFAATISNPFLPMSIVIRDLYTDGFEIEEGDEIAVFDNNLLVGSLMLLEDNKGYSMITARKDDPVTAIVDGYEAGNEFSFKFYDKSEDELYTNIEINRVFGDITFNPLGTFMGDLKISSLGESEFGLPRTTYLEQNFPNPYSDQTRIHYGIAEDAKVKLSVHDVSGRTITILENSDKAAGKYTINMYKATLEAGVYYYRIEVVGKDSKFSETRKMIIL